MPASSAHVLTVSELTELVKNLLEGSFPSVIVEGEISNCRPASSGHLYFTLKDRDSMVQAVMFRGRARSLPFEPSDGTIVRATGSISVYSARGQYQLLVERLERAGIGEILAIIEERKSRLAAEGLFDPGRKRAIPRFPSRIAIISSPTGAAIHDILNILARRNAGLDIVILPAAVQGESAPMELVSQIRTANAFSMADAIILGRGGGSLEDLLAFSDESVVRAVAASGIPVISAVGHEIDWALTDFAADLRAPTPSAAAELVSESREILRAEVAQRAIELETVIRSRLERARSALSRFEPEAIEGRFMRFLHPVLRKFDEAKEIIIRDFEKRMEETRHRLQLARGALEAASPSAVLARGFSVVRKHGSDRAVRAASEISAGDALEILFAHGDISARVEEVRK